MSAGYLFKASLNSAAVMVEADAISLELSLSSFLPKIVRSIRTALTQVDSKVMKIKFVVEFSRRMEEGLDATATKRVLIETLKESRWS
jgi:hypothetical protein